MTIQIRPAQPGDDASIIEFNRRLAWETEGKTLDGETIRLGVHAVLRDNNKGFYHVAIAGERIVGQVMITYEWSDWRNGWIWWLQSVYVDAEFRQKGVFRQLFESLEERARREGNVVLLRLYVEKENERGHATYESLGMQRAPYDFYEMPLG